MGFSSAHRVVNSWNLSTDLLSVPCSSRHVVINVSSLVVVGMSSSMFPHFVLRLSLFRSAEINGGPLAIKRIFLSTVHPPVHSSLWFRINAQSPIVWGLFECCPFWGCWEIDGAHSGCQFCFPLPYSSAAISCHSTEQVRTAEFHEDKHGNRNKKPETEWGTVNCLNMKDNESHIHLTVVRAACTAHCNLGKDIKSLLKIHLDRTLGKDKCLLSLC